MVSRHPIYKASISPKTSPLRQGEIVTDLLQIMIDLKTFSPKNDDYRIDQKRHPYAIVVSQDCDLEQDFNLRVKIQEREKIAPVPDDDTLKRRLLESVLFCVIETADEVAKTHPIEEVRHTRGFNHIAKNKDERFYFFEKVPPQNDSAGKGLPEMVVEFKRFFSLPTTEVYRRIDLGMTKRRCQLHSPYLEHFSLRFHYYHNRIALPHDHESE